MCLGEEYLLNVFEEIWDTVKKKYDFIVCFAFNSLSTCK